MTQSVADAFESALARVLQRSIDDFERIAAWERLSGGASQETYRVRIHAGGGERLLCLRRSPGGEHVAERRPGLRTEARLMQAARAAGIPEPRVHAVLEPSDGLGEGFLMEWLEGETLGARIARADELAAIRPKLAFQCGEILARIHGVDLDATDLRGALDALTPEQCVELTWERYRSYATPQPMIDYSARWLRDHLPPRSEPALVHNDFRNGNLMIGPSGVVAVLDWEIAHVGDPLRDLGWLCTHSWRFGRPDLPVGGFGRLEDLLAGYASVTGKSVDPEHVRFWIVYGSFSWAVGCLTMAEHFRTGPDKTVERPAIGRRSSECQADCANLLLPGPVELVEPEPPREAAEMPRLDELLASVRDHLRGDVMGASRGRAQFMARVAANSLDIALRDLALGPAHRRRELARLRALLGVSGELEELRWRLVHGLRDGSLPLDLPGLGDHLRQTVLNQLAIDQPSYPALATARAHP